MEMLEKSPADRPENALAISERLSQLREAPRMVESSSTQAKKKILQAPLQETASVYSGIEKSFRWAWGGLTAVLFILAVVWALNLFKPDPGVALWIKTANQHANPNVQIAAIESLSKLAYKQDNLLDEMMKIIESQKTKPEVAVAALRALGKHQINANRFRSRITKIATKGTNEAVRIQARTTLNELEQPL